MTNAIDTIRRYFSAGNDVFVASSLPTVDDFNLSKRSIVHLQKRVDWCTSTTYCANGSHCIGGGLCQNDFNWYWIVAVAVFLDILTIYICIRRRRTAAAMASQPAIETTAVVPQNQYSVYPPPPAVYSSYSPAGGPANSAPYSLAPNSAAAATPATAYSAPCTPSSAGQPQLVGNAAPALYPVPQGEASSYAPPK